MLHVVFLSVLIAFHSMAATTCFWKNVFLQALHITIRVGWLRLLPPPRLCRGLDGLWLVAAVAHSHCASNVARSVVHVYLPRRLRVRRLRPRVSILRFFVSGEAACPLL